MRWPLLLVTLIAGLFTACGGGSNDKAEIEEAATAFFQALIDDPPTAYTYLSQNCKDQMPFLEFAASNFFFSSVTGDHPLELRDLEIIERRDDAIVASFDLVIVTEDEDVPLLPTDETEPARFVKEDGRWRLDDCTDLGFGFGNAEGTGDSEVVPAESRYAAAQAAEADDDPALPGEFVDLQEIYGGFYANRDGPTTAPHARAEVDYAADGNSNPPAGGPHWGSRACGDDPVAAPPLCGPAPWGIYRAPWPPETLLHNMEHGGVIVWYNTQNRDIVNELEDAIEERVRGGDLLVMTPYPGMEREQIAITAWSRIDAFPTADYSLARVEAFIDAHMRRFNPEEF